MVRKKKHNRRNKQPQKTHRTYTPLSQHQKKGSALQSPWKKKFPFQMWDWARDLLPEHLWIAAVVDRFGKERAHLFYYRFMDAIDEVWPAKDSVPLGLITDFGVIPEEARHQLWEHHETLLVECFHEPIARILTFYPENPAHWLVRDDLVEKGGHVDPDVELGRLRCLVKRLYPRRGEYASTVQALSFGRLLRHGKIQLGKEVGDLVPLLEKYPISCTDQERAKVESMTRSLMSGICQREDRYQGRDWPKYFWRHNLDLAICRPDNIVLEVTNPFTEEDARHLQEVLQRNVDRARRYLDRLSIQVKCDLYRPERDEILFGLFARLTRLYLLIMEDPNLWARDVAGVLLRCLADTAITFGYLAKCGQDDDFQRFREYGEGQEKLLMLHLQDSYPGDKSLDGRDVEAMRSELGWFAPELMDIELGHWAKKDARKLAQMAGMEKYYRLVYTPMSSDVHGSWVSLKYSSLCQCTELLHRFHRLPSYMEPPVFLGFISAAQGMFQDCIEMSISQLGYPTIEEPVEPFPWDKPASKEDDESNKETENRPAD